MENMIKDYQYNSFQLEQMLKYLTWFKNKYYEKYSDTDDENHNINYINKIEEDIGKKMMNEFNIVTDYVKEMSCIR